MARRSIAERFFRFVDKRPGPDGCWNWIGARNEAGYGRFHVSVSVGTQLAHRWSYMMEKRVVLDEDEPLDHLCKNRACVRPLHLDPVTHAVNTARGDSVTAENARRQTCRKGHAFTESNTYRNAKGGRQCRECMRAANARYSRNHPEVARHRVQRFRDRRA